MIWDSDEADEDVTRRLGLADLADQLERPIYLVLVSAGGQTGGWNRIARDREMVIGRGDVDIPVEVDGVSRRHAKVKALPGDQLLLEDLGSTNGTFCNGERITSQILKEGDKITVGTAILVVVMSDDASDNAQMSQYVAATRDRATQLYSREYFLESLSKEFAFATRNDLPLSLVLLDLGEFSELSATHGKLPIQKLLPRMGRLLMDVTRLEDIPARYDANRMVILLREAPLDESVAFADRIRRSIQNLEPELGLKLSAGVTTYASRNYAIPNEMLIWAESYLSEAISAGRDRTCSGRGRAGPSPK